MAVLSDADRRDVWARWMRQNTEACGVTKAELRAAFDAADDWANANAGAFNSALPLPARAALNAAQKALVLSLVIQQRWVRGA